MKRIELLSGLLKGYDTVADIGSDHGYVLKYAFDNNYIKYGIVGEIAEGPLQNAKSTLSNYPVTFYLSDGFDKIDAPFDIGVISGMGVYTIIDILNRAPKKEYLLQPNDKHEILREYLNKNDYQIVNEYITFDKFFYIIIHVKPGKETLSDEDIFLGPKLKYKPEAKKFYKHKLSHYNSIIKKCDQETKNKLSNYINMLKGVLK
ncbi:MAG: tRNA (adenine(22)-N(1))-methyltransferase [Acholeplasmataceae bacterium]|jgi:tRNA (adenine22-N1)-methyltransferase